MTSSSLLRADAERPRPRLMLAVSALLGFVAGGSAQGIACPGSIELRGYGPVALTNAQWNLHWDAAGGVEVPDSHTVRPLMSGRTYFADTCINGSYSHERYIALKLLGKKFKYTTDVSSAGCGCNAALYLAAMPQNNRPSECSDYYCDANSVCGVQCTEIDLQEANRHAFQTTLHAATDKGGLAKGFGGGLNWNGPRDWEASQYAPGADCLDTAKPFNVEVAFPMTETGELRSLDTTLSQEGRECRLHSRMDALHYKGIAEVSRALAAGMTPVISYWKSSNMLWLDGKGQDGKGECTQDHPETCGESVQFFNFAVESLDGTDAEVSEPSGSTDSSPLPSPASQEAPKIPPAPSPGEGSSTSGYGVQDELDSIARIFDYATAIEKEEGQEERDQVQEEQEDRGGLEFTPSDWRQPDSLETLRGTTSATKEYKFVGFAAASAARLACGDRWRLATPQAPEEWNALSAAMAKAMQHGSLSTTWPHNHVWLAGQWSLSNARWLWDNRRPIEPSVLSTRWAAGSPTDSTTQAEKPWLCMNSQGQVRDVGSDATLGVMCESAAPDHEEVAQPTPVVPAASSSGLDGSTPLGAPPGVSSASIDNAAYHVVMQKHDLHGSGAPGRSIWDGLGSLPWAVGFGIAFVAMLSMGLVVASRRLPPRIAGTLYVDEGSEQRFALQGQFSQFRGFLSRSSYQAPSDMLNNEGLA